MQFSAPEIESETVRHRQVLPSTSNHCYSAQCMASKTGSVKRKEMVRCSGGASSTLEKKREKDQTRRVTLDCHPRRWNGRGTQREVKGLRSQHKLQGRKEVKEVQRSTNGRLYSRTTAARRGREKVQVLGLPMVGSARQ